VEKMVINTGVRVTSARMEKIGKLASQLGVTRNRAWNMLVDAAVVNEKLAVNLSKKANIRSANACNGNTSDIQSR
jgi:hypothetical protein